MTFHLKRNLILCGVLMVLITLQWSAAEDGVPGSEQEESEDNDSSSEETVEESNEAAERRKRAVDDASAENNSKQATSPGPGQVTASGERAALPGLPDPQTLLKVAEIFQSVGEKVIPLLLEGTNASNKILDRVNRDVKFLENFKQEIDTFAERLKLRPNHGGR